MRNIELMINDGMLGQKSVLLALSALTTGNLNSKLKKEATPYKMQDVVPMAYEYIVPPLTEEEKQAQAQKNLLAYMQAAPKSPESLRKMGQK